MLIVYRRSTGEVVDNTGTNSEFPEGPEDSVALVNTDNRKIARKDLAILRINDITQASLVSDILNNTYHVDPATKRVVIDGPKPQPEVFDPGPDLLVELIARVEALEEELQAFKSTTSGTPSTE